MRDNLLYLLVITIFAISSCAEEPEKEISVELSNHQEIYELGILGETTYKHATFGFEIDCPEGWDRWDRERSRKYLYDISMAQDGDERVARIMSANHPGAHNLLTLFKNKNAEVTRGPSIVLEVVDAAVLYEKGMKSYTEWVDQVQNYNHIDSMAVISEGKYGNAYKCLRQRIISVSSSGQRFIQDSYKYNLGKYWVSIVVSCSEEDLEKYEHIGLSLRDFKVSK